MGHAVPKQHPAVVLRSHFNVVRALLGLAMIAVVGLTIAVVIVANNEEELGGSATATPAESIEYGGFNPATGRPDTAPLPQEQPLQGRTGTLRYDGGPEEGTALQGIRPSSASPAPVQRYDGGPEEGTALQGIRPSSASPAPAQRYDGGPEEGTAVQGIRPAPAASVQRFEGIPSPAAAQALEREALRYDGGPEEGTTGPGVPAN
jgi:hypothetical protein